MESKAKWLSRLASLGIGTVCSKLAVFLLMPLYSASLTPSEFGTVDILISTAVLLLPLCSAYAPETAFRFIAGGEREGAVLAVGRRLLWRGSGLFCVLLPLVGLVPATRPFLWHLLCYVSAATLHSYYAHILRARGQYGFFAVQQVFCTLVTVTLAFLFLTVLRLGVGGYLAAVYLADALTAAVLVGYLRPKSDQKADPVLYRAMLRYGLPLIPTALLWWVISALDRYVLLWLHGAEPVGLYAAACKLPVLLTLASGIFLEVWQYASLRLREDEQKRVFDRVYGMLLPLLILFALVLMLTCRPLLGVLLASDFAEALPYVPFYTVALLFSALSSFLGSVYSVKLRSKESCITAALGAAVHAVGCALFVPRLAIGGAVAATACAYIAVYLRRMADCRRFLPFDQRLGKLMLSVGGLLLTALACARGEEGIAFLCTPVVLLPFGREFIAIGRELLGWIQKIRLLSTKKQKRS
ncbi:MAG: lipopolysaccharide biosynthesis protein [Clostridia bacterium]|nr:lipopolysaccharide biosynthesis protein [Clostridia bacterium]